MRVFISWSGNTSHCVAVALKEWLPYIFTDIEAFVSSENVRKGQRWLVEISNELSTCNFGIICLTPENLEAPWLLFEAGALSKLPASHVCTLIVGDLRPGDIEGPLSHFQATTFTKADFFKLMQSINSALGKKKLHENRLGTMFDKWWGDLENKISQASKIIKSEVSVKRSQLDLLHDVIEITRSIARNLPMLSNPNEGNVYTYHKLTLLIKCPLKEL